MPTVTAPDLRKEPDYMASPVRITVNPDIMRPPTPPTPEQLARIQRVASARGLEMPDVKTKSEAQRWLNSRNMFASPDANPNGYSENRNAGRRGNITRWHSE